MWHEMVIEQENGKQVHHIHHRGHHKNDIPFPTPINSSPKGQCSLLPQHNGHQTKAPLELSAGGPK